MPTGGGAAGAVLTAGAGAAANSQPAGSNTVSLLPWLAGIIVLAALAGLAIFFLMRRNAPATEEGLAGDGDYDAPSPLVVAAPSAIAPTAEEVRCPNCDALNPPGLRFCDQCGQDLRPPAAAAPPVVNEATVPYLETVSRVDEQLEFVLARATVTIGRAMDNDIVVDEQFAGWESVSQHHARLTQETEGFVVEDLDSETGTFVNGARTGRNLLEDGMRLAFGTVEFIYRVPQS